MLTQIVKAKAFMERKLQYSHIASSCHFYTSRYKLKVKPKHRDLFSPVSKVMHHV